MLITTETCLLLHIWWL